MRRERDAACLRAASDARRAACARLREGLAVASAALDAAAATDQARHADDVRRLLELKASTDAAMEYAATYSAARRSAHEARTASRRKEAAELLAKGINPHETFRRRDEAARAKRAERLAQKAHAEREAEIRSRLRREEGEYARRRAEEAAARATRERRETRASRRAAHVRTSAYMRASTREGVDVLDATGHGGVYASEASNAKPARFGTGIAPDEEALRASLREVSRRRTARRVAHGARTRDARARGGETRGKGGDGRGRRGTRRERRGELERVRARARRASVLEVDDANDDATSNANDDATSNDAPSDPDAIERRKRRDAVLAIENARLLDVAASRMADPDRLYTRDPVRRDARGRRVRVQSVARRLSRFRGWKTVPETRHHHERVVRHVDVSRDGVSGGTPRVVRRRVRPPGKPLGGDVVARHGDLRAENRANVTHHPIALHDRGRGGDSGGVPPESRERARATTTEVDFGAVVVGETRRRTFALENAGATPAAFELVDPGSESSARVRTTRTSNDPSSRSPSRRGRGASPRGRHRRSRERGGRPRVRVRRRRRDVRAKSGSARGRVRRGGGGSMDTRRRQTRRMASTRVTRVTRVTVTAAEVTPSTDFRGHPRRPRFVLRSLHLARFAASRIRRRCASLATSSISERARRDARPSRRRSSGVTAATAAARAATRARRNPSRASSTSSRSISSSSHTPRPRPARS